MISRQPMGRTQRSDLTEAECWELLQATTIGRVGFVHPEGVKILPVNYVLADKQVIIRTNPTGRLAMLTETGQDVAFEIDYHNRTNGSGWSVLMSGTVAAMTAPEIDALHSGGRVVPWAGSDRSLHLRFVPTTIEGRRVRRRR